jgi:hypothetical protein
MLKIKRRMKLIRHVLHTGTTEYRKKYKSLRERKDLEDQDVNDNKRSLWNTE